MEQDSNIEVLEIEDYKGEKDQKFSHQFLVMKILNKCMEAGAKEMRSGYWNIKSDKFGNVNKIYVPDSRKEFIETVKTAMDTMSRDFDKQMEEAVSKVNKKLKEEYKRLLDIEKRDWDNAPIKLKQNRWSTNIYYQEGTLNTNLSYFHMYLEFEVKCHREILNELNKLNKRLKDYQTEDYEA